MTSDHQHASATTAIIAAIAAAVSLATAVPASARTDKDLTRCLAKTGLRGVKCLRAAVDALEGAVSPAPDSLDPILARTEATVLGRCNTEQAETLGYVGLPDMTFRISQACSAFALELNAMVFTEDQAGLTPSQEDCRQQVYKHVGRLLRRTTGVWGKRCLVKEYQRGTCNRTRRDVRVERKRARTTDALERACGADFDAVNAFEGATLADRIATFVDTVIVRGRHFAQRVYPPNTLAPVSEFGSYPVGVTTLPLVDASRLNVQGTGPRPVTVEVYYPTTEPAIEGVPRDVVQIFGIDITETPAYRDVDLAAGTYPLIVFSHGNLGIRIQSFFFAAHLASHGFVVASPDHHGNTFVDSLLGILDPAVVTNRPLDMSFLIDEMLTFNATSGGFFENAIDPARIAAAGHSFGGLTSFALAAGAFEDTRVSAIMPHAPAAPFGPSFFADVTIPVLIVGGSIDATTPFESQQQTPYDLISPGASVVALAELDQAGHFTFSDFCEVPSDLLGFLGGAEEACEPRHLPWRYGQDIVRYLSLSFFRAVLNGDPGALQQLAPELVNTFDGVRFESK